MRFKISASELSAKLNTLAKVINPKNSISILGSFHFNIQDGTLTITASDDSNLMRYSIPLIESDSNGSFCVPTKIMLSAVKELAEQPVTFEVNTSDYSIQMIYQNGKYNLVGQNSEDYPQLQTLNGQYTQTSLSAASLAQNIQRSIFAVANDELRMVMNGIFFDLTEESLNIVASDGQKLVRNMIFSSKNELPASFILPQKPASLLRTVLNSEDETTVTLKFDDKSAEFSFEDGTLSCILIEGRFPDYNRVIPKDNPNILVIDRKSLAGALRRILPFTNEATFLVKLRLTMNNLELIAEDIENSKMAHEDIVCDYNGTPMNIGFKGTVLAEIANNLTSDDITIELGDPSRAGVVRPNEQPENEDVLMLIMPMLIND